MFEPVFIQKLRINYPYIWRTQIHIFLPIFIVIITTAFLSSSNMSYKFNDNLPTKNHFDLLAFFIRIYLIIIFMLMFILLSRFPLKIASKRHLVMTFMLYFICIIITEMGPRLYAVNVLEALTLIPKTAKMNFEQLESDVEVAYTFCGNPTTNEKLILIQTLDKYDIQLKNVFKKKQYKINYSCEDWMLYINNGKKLNIKEGKFPGPTKYTIKTIKEFIKKLEIIIIAKKHSLKMEILGDNYRLTNYTLYIFSAILSALLLVFTNKRFVSTILSFEIYQTTHKFYVSITSFRLFRILEDKLCSNYPSLWSLGAHFGLKTIAFNVVIFSIIFYSFILHNTKAIEGVVFLFLVTIFMLHYSSYINRQHQIKAFADTFLKNLQNFSLIYLIHFFNFFIYFIFLFLLFHNKEKFFDLSFTIYGALIFTLPLTQIFAHVIWSSRKPHLLYFGNTTAIIYIITLSFYILGSLKFTESFPIIISLFMLLEAVILIFSNSEKYIRTTKYLLNFLIVGLSASTFYIFFEFLIIDDNLHGSIGIASALLMTFILILITTGAYTKIQKTKAYPKKNKYSLF